MVLAAAFLKEWPEGRIAAHHELRGYNALGDAYKCPAMNNRALDTIRQCARDLQASTPQLSVMTRRNHRVKEYQDGHHQE